MRLSSESCSRFARFYAIAIGLIVLSAATAHAQIPTVVPEARCIEYLNTAPSATAFSPLFNIHFSYYDSIAGLTKIRKEYPSNYFSPDGPTTATQPLSFYLGYHRDSPVYSEVYVTGTPGVTVLNWKAVTWHINSFNTQGVPLGDVADSGSLTASPTCATELSLNNLTFTGAGTNTNQTIGTVFAGPPVDANSTVVLSAYSSNPNITVANLAYTLLGTSNIITGDITTAGADASGTVFVQMTVNGTTVADSAFTVVY